ncbi:MAG: UbiA prenyltransferase family protein [Bacilli bacterium]|nr:UbiA prenyltransferase family protein [Bacilli bacterium]
MVDFIKLIRVKHFFKNIIIFLPLVFSGLFFNMSLILRVIYGFICFSLIASCIYIINDIRDYENDKKHPTKKNRPIASGAISIKKASYYCIFLFLIANILIILFKMPLIAAFLLYFYFILNVAYSMKLKNIPFLDIIILVSGFVIRLVFGAQLINIPLSNWLLLTVITISFYMGLGKRRGELGKNTRSVLKYYTKEFLDKNMYMLLSCSIVFYSLWTVDSKVVLKNNNYLVWTVPLVILMAMKYSMNIEGVSDADPVEVLFHDKLLICLILIYIVVMFLLLYVL